MNKSKKDKKPKIEKAIKKLVNQHFKNISPDDESGYLYEELIRRVERELIAQVMQHTQQNQSQATKILGLSRTTLRKKLKVLGLDTPS